ncbi:carbon-nitrogen hydrolase family protein [Sinorhizobium terangae]|uniref:carbon-nitrogen hydrolase family protein n=1 Tax=Sinorhizobium terangae TaxID=110322 RepID=UPI0024B0CDF4|nr:carbon-nitrogen hydrolase family protein [Sinorhizobium terangae]WFU50192.1 carbon-nitrogen hydrolase family protein [Sinorhizobium terangae]
MKISLVQMNSQPDRDRNLRTAESLMLQAIKRDTPDLMVLPEHFDWSGGTAAEKLAAADQMPGGEAYRMLQAFAAREKVWIHGGSLLERIEGSSKIYNTTVVFDPHGNEVGRYRKVHLFDIEAPDGKIYRESATVAPGESLFVYEAGGFRIGCAICYDLRFPRLFDALANAGVDVIILPAAFTLQTGKDHWEVLCRARAIEHQVYFVACGQWGGYTAADGDRRFTYGNSLVCDPWGQVIARAVDQVGIVSTHLDHARVAAVRKLIPSASHKVSFVDQARVYRDCSRGERCNSSCGSDEQTFGTPISSSGKSARTPEGGPAISILG